MGLRLEEGSFPVGVAPTLENLETILRERFPEALLSFSLNHDLPDVTVEPSRLVDLCRFLRDDPALQFDYLCLLGGTDWPAKNQIEVFYHLGSMVLNLPRHRVILRVFLDRAAPQVDSLAGVWKAADWQERETYDLLGVEFRGHPDLRRILLPSVWEGYPLRKDYAYDADTMVPEILEAEGIDLAEYAGRHK